GRRELRVEADRLTQRLGRLIEIAETDQRRAKCVERERLTRIRGRPEARQLQRLVVVLDRVAVIAPRDEESFTLAHPIAKLERLFGVCRGERRLSGVRVHARE